MNKKNVANEKVSIVIPVYNAEKTLEMTLNSVKSIDYNNFEVILINDGSSDNSENICLKFTKIDNRFKLYSQNNKGVSEARNLGIKKSVGKYILFVDSDDRVTKFGVTSLVNAQHEEEEAFVFGSFLMRKSRNREIKRQFQKNKYTLDDKGKYEECLSSIPTAPWAKLYKKDIIEKKGIQFPKDIPFGEDAVFLYQYLENVDSLLSINDIVYEYYYVDKNSAGRKYYREFNTYIHRQYLSKLNLYKLLGLENKLNMQTYFNMALEHYIINEKNTKVLEEKILQSTLLFPKITNEDYMTFIEKKDIKNLVRKWKKNNRLYYFTEKIKCII